jgi:hypothetical protein
LVTSSFCRDILKASKWAGGYEVPAYLPQVKNLLLQLGVSDFDHGEAGEASVAPSVTPSAAAGRASHAGPAVYPIKKWIRLSRVVYGVPYAFCAEALSVSVGILLSRLGRCATQCGVMCRKQSDGLV